MVSWLPMPQVGVRQELQDEAGAVMGMRVGERRRFAVPQELAFKRKAFGQPVPANQVCEKCLHTKYIKNFQCLDQVPLII